MNKKITCPVCDETNDETSKICFGRINASVFYFKKYIKYNITKQIWEVWNKKTIALVSCGKILNKIHQKDDGLPNTDVYLDLAHINFSKYSINKKDHISWIQHQTGEEKIVLLTQRISSQCLNSKNFFDLEQKKYKLIYLVKFLENQKITYFNRFFGEVQANPYFILVDIEI